MPEKTYEENVQDCLEYCLGLSDDPEFLKNIRKASHAERNVFLLDNGFEFDIPEKDAQILEKYYRKEAKDHPTK